MAEISLNYPIPSNDDDFDQLCRSIFGKHWGIPHLARHGRSGQRQNGDDFYGTNDRGVLHGGQSKLRAGRKGLTAKEVLAEIEEAKTFIPPLGYFMIVTSSQRDVHLQKLERELDAKHRKAGLFSVKIVFWDD